MNRRAFSRLLQVALPLLLVGTGVLLAYATVLAQTGGPTVSIETAKTVNESAGSVSIQVTLTNPPSDTVRVQYSCISGTAVSPADYTDTSDTLTFTPPVTTMYIIVPITNDMVAESDKTFQVVLSNPVGATIGNGTCTVTITDDDSGGGGGTWEAYLLPSFEIKTECVFEYPTPRDRTEIGGGEQVICSIDQWDDKDKFIPTSGSPYVEQDAMGEVTWSVMPSGASVMPTTGPTTTLTADFPDFDTPFQLVAQVKDSGAKGQDPLTQKEKGMVTKVPNGLTGLSASDKADPAWEAGTMRMGSRGVFMYQVQPSNLPNFANYNFYKYRAQAEITWKGDGESKDTIPAVQELCTKPNTITPNVIEVHHSTGLHLASRINKLVNNQTVPVDDKHSLTLKFFAKAPNKALNPATDTAFATATEFWAFAGNPSGFSSPPNPGPYKSSISVSIGGGALGTTGWMGPWK